MRIATSPCKKSTLALDILDLSHLGAKGKEARRRDEVALARVMDDGDTLRDSVEGVVVNNSRVTVSKTPEFVRKPSSHEKQTSHALQWMVGSFCHAVDH